MTDLHHCPLAHTTIQKVINQPDYGDMALHRFFGTVRVNRVPFRNDAPAATSIGSVLDSEGQELGKSGGRVSLLMERDYPDWANVPTIELRNEVRDSLAEVGEGKLENPLATPSSFGKDLDRADENWSSALTCEMIPGHVN